jgi:DNA-binding NarL/FixJ family response regulator
MRSGQSPGGPTGIGGGGLTARSRLAVVTRRVDSDDVHIHGATRRGVKVLVVGGHQLLADSLAIALSADPGLEVMGSETDPERALTRIRRVRPDVVLLNNSLGGSDCAEVICRLRTEAPDLKIIVLTSYSDDEDSLLACVQAGASGHQTTDRQPNELVDSIKRVHAGELDFAPDVLVNLMTRPRSPGPPPRAPEARTPPLAPRELQVLQTVATGMSTGDAASALGITVHTVRAHLKNVMSKLQAHSKLEAVIFALKRGLIELPE